LFLALCLGLTENAAAQFAWPVVPRTDAQGDPLPEGVFYRLGTNRVRHWWIKTLIFSADGSQVLSQGDKELRLWDVASGRLVRQTNDHSFDTCLTASPDGRYLADVIGGCIHVVEWKTGDVIAELDTQEVWMSLAFSADSKALVGLTADAVICSWDLASRQETARHVLHGLPPEFARATYRFWSLSADGAVVVGRFQGFADQERQGTWHFWNTAMGKEDRPGLKTHHLASRAADCCWCLSPDGRMLAMTTEGGVVEVWDTRSGKRLALDAEPVAQMLSLDPGGRHLALADRGEVSLWDLDTGKRVWHVNPTGERASALTFTADGKTLAVGSATSITMLDVATGKRTGFSQGDPGRFWGPGHFGGDGTLVVAHGGKLSVRAMAAGEEIRTFSAAELLPGASRQADARPARFHPEGRLVSSSADGRRQAWHRLREVTVTCTTTGRVLLVVPQGRAQAFAPDGNMAAFIDEFGREVTLRDMASGTVVRRWSDALAEFTGVSFSPDSRTLALSTREGTVLVCDVTGLATAPGQLPHQQLTHEAGERLWGELASDDGPRAHKAMWSLVAAGAQAVEILREHLKPVAVHGQVACFIAELDSERFTVREKATLALLRLPNVRPELEAAMARQPSAEVQRRLEFVLSKIGESPRDVELYRDPEQRRAWRALTILEQVGTAEARRLLESVAAGAAHERVTMEAQAALQRLKQRG
jgi:WD40 repeat protein